MRQHEQAVLLLKKAADDEALLVEVFASNKVSDEIFGYHCQQAAEKSLKALLSEIGVVYPRTHNLRFLMDLLADAGHALPEELAELDMLTPYGTLFRYEDLPAELAVARRSLLDMVKALHALADSKITLF